jgi:hypothetical protein
MRRIAQALQPDGVLIVLEWAWELFDEDSARWCFERLTDDDTGWVRGCRDDWLASGQPWASYLDGRTRAERFHSGQDMVDALTRSFATQELEYGPYFFADLRAVSAEDEQAAIADGAVRANGITYVGRPIATGAGGDGAAWSRGS